MEVFEVERMRKEIDNYIEHIIICHEKNDFEMMKEESISLLFWGSQMIEVNNTIRQRKLGYSYRDLCDNGENWKK